MNFKGGISEEDWPYMLWFGQDVSGARESACPPIVPQFPYLNHPAEKKVLFSE